MANHTLAGIAHGYVMVLLCGAPARSKTTTAVGFCEVASEQLEGFETHHICFDELEAVGRAGASAARFDVEVWSTACRVAFDRTAELLHTPIRLAPHDWWLCTITCTSTVCAVSTSAGRDCHTHNKRSSPPKCTAPMTLFEIPCYQPGLPLGAPSVQHIRIPSRSK